jgi:hypothetical protein
VLTITPLDSTNPMREDVRAIEFIPPHYIAMLLGKLQQLCRSIRDKYNKC